MRICILEIAYGLFVQNKCVSSCSQYFNHSKVVYFTINLADISPVNPFHLSFFRNLIQIGRILDTTTYAKIMLPEEKKLKLEDSLAIKLDF